MKKLKIAEEAALIVCRSKRLLSPNLYCLRTSLESLALQVDCQDASLLQVFGKDWDQALFQMLFSHSPTQINSVSLVLCQYRFSSLRTGIMASHREEEVESQRTYVENKDVCNDQDF